VYLPKHNGWLGPRRVFSPFRHNSPSIPLPVYHYQLLQLPRAKVTNLKPSLAAAVERSPRRLFYFYSHAWVCVMCECARSIDCARVSPGKSGAAKWGKWDYGPRWGGEVVENCVCVAEFSRIRFGRLVPRYVIYIRK